MLRVPTAAVELQSLLHLFGDEEIVKALVFQDKLTLVNDAPDPENPAEALVQVLYAGICNTDIEISKGYAGFQGILGHEFVGRVVSSEPGLHQKRVVGEINVGCGTCDLCVAGDQRHCSERTVLGIKGREGSFAEFLQLPVCNLLEVPESVGDETAVFTEPLAAACRITEQLPEGMQSVLVVGDGKLGQLIARVLALKASRVAIVGKHQSKLRMAELACGAVGFDVIGGRAEVRKQVLDWNSGRRVDVVVEATGSTAGLETAVQLVRPRGVPGSKDDASRNAHAEYSRGRR